VHVAPGRRSAQLVGERRQGVAVVLVIAGYEQDGPTVRPLAREPHSRGAEADVTREHDHIGLDRRQLERAELDVEVADNVQAQEPGEATPAGAPRR
jgi:hypothetical protein